VFVPSWAAEAVITHVGETNAGGTDPVFSIPRRSVQSEHNRACGLAGIVGGYTIHDHKHTAAVALARAGMPLPILQRQLGHKNIAMTMKYAAFHPDYSDAVVYFDRVAERFGLTASGNTPGNSEATTIEAVMAS